MATKKTTEKADISAVTGETAQVDINTPVEDKTPAETTTGANEELYTAEDFVAAAEEGKLFDKNNMPSRYIIVAAFRYNKKTKVTREEGVALVKEFMNKKVS